MSIIRTILIKSIVKPFYRQHAGLFVFLFVILFGAVGVVDGAGIFEYHYSLIRGLLMNPFLFLLVLFLWLLYAKKTEQFIVSILARPEFSFLQTLLLLDRKVIFRRMLWVQFLLFIPILLYAFIIFSAAIYLHVYVSGWIILLYPLSVCLISARWYLFIMENPGRAARSADVGFSFIKWETPYWSIFLRYIGRNKKLLFAGIKIYNCTLLFGMVSNRTGTAYDLGMILLFFSLGILGHGLLIHQMRELEETRLAYYRTVPVSLVKRFLQYGILYFILLTPEFITIAFLTPYFLHLTEALLFALFSFSMLLFLNSLLFIQFFNIKDYLKIILCIFFLIYFSVLTASLFLLCILFFISSITIFFRRYYLFAR